ncbi:MAG: hypothetical protein ACXVC7_03575 [Bacteroidia bacterium]
MKNVLFFFLFAGPYASILLAQVTILNAGITPFNVTPRSMLEVNLLNAKTDVQAVMHAKLLNGQNEPMLDVVSMPFTIRGGMNNASQMNIGISSVNYASGNAGNILKTMHVLSSGKYTYCVSITGVDIADELCESLESDYSAFLFLVSPYDKEEIETKYPLLLWTHSDPFARNDINGYYRIIVTDVFKGQSAEGAVNTNVPVYMKDHLSLHEVQYPIDAKELLVGKTYAWQVQKITDGVITNKTEAWEFKLKTPEPVKENKYAIIKKALDGSTYTAVGNKIFFRVDEGYGGKNLQYKILNDKQQAISAQETGEKSGKVKMEAINMGYNKYTIDLNMYKIPTGTYVLEVTNDKKEIYKLKFIVE